MLKALFMERKKAMSNLRDVGTYTGSLLEIESGVSSNDTPFIFTKWELEDGSEARIYTYFSDLSWDKAEQKMDGIGFNGDFENPDCTVTETELKCTHRTYEGEDKEQWEFASWGGAQIDPLNKNDAKALNAQWKKTHKAKEKAGAKKKASPPKKSPPARKTPPKKSKKTPDEAREDAWEALITNPDNSSVDDEDMANLWEETIGKVHGDKEEADFTADDWKEVEKACAVF